MDAESNKKKRIVLGVMLVAVVIVTLASTFAYFISQTQSTQEKLTVTTGTMKITFADLENATATINGSLELGGAPIVKEFKIENTGTEEVTTNILWHNLINTYMYRSLSYSLYSAPTAGAYGATPIKTGNVPQSKVLSDKTLAEVTIPGGTTHYYKLEIKLEYLEDVDQTSDINAKLVTNFTAGDATVEMVPSIVTSIVENKTPTQFVKSGTPMFNTMALTDETANGLYKAEDNDGGTSYYFRGASENNYVKFANKYWRIIRINSDGSVRMIYDGTVAHKNGEASTDRLTKTGQAWSSTFDDAKYVGWMYGGDKGEASDDKGLNYEDTTKVYAQNNQTNSDIKTVVDDWYKTNIADANLGQYVADAGFCNDRTIPGKEVTKWEADTGLGYAKNVTGYGAFSRFIDPTDLDPVHHWMTAKDTDVNPTLKCKNSNDLFTTATSTKGNKALQYPVGLITIDEASMAGGFTWNGDSSPSNNRNYYLYKGSWYWSLSPYHFGGGTAFVFLVNGNGYLYNSYVNYTGGAVAPVISLKAEHAKQFEGYGTLEAPYQIKGVA